MKWFVFRNNTIEGFFDEKATSFSGYDDISQIPSEAGGFVWFYQVPVKFNSASLAQEIDGIAGKLEFVCSQIGNKPIVVFTLVSLVELKLTTSDHLVSEAIATFNTLARKLAKENQNIKVIDFSEFTSRYNSEQLVNWKYYFISHCLLNPKLAKDFKVWWNRIEEELLLRRKKCLIIDLDNTLWGGILGEDGPGKIQIGGDYPGKAFLYWQQGLVELCKNGVILAVCSKNNESDVLEAWKSNPFMHLKLEHISAYRINWQDKATNIQELAEELNIGLDSMVFVDDNPSERELVKQMLPMVEVPDFPRKPFELVTFFQRLVTDYFRINEVTSDDVNKVGQYRAIAKRKAEQQRFMSFEGYLRSLEIEIKIDEANEFNLSRISQLTQKTNQFNLTILRCSEDDILQMKDAGCYIFCISVADRFGDNGITGVMIVKPISSDTAEVENLLLSCRILGKGIEYAFTNYIFQVLKEKGYKLLTSSYVPTKKNQQVSDFWDKMGGEIVEKTDLKTTYVISLNRNFEIKEHYRIVQQYGK